MWYIFTPIIALILIWLLISICMRIHDFILRMKSGKHKFFSRSVNKEIWEKEFNENERKTAYEVLDIIAEAFAYFEFKYTLRPDDEIMDIYFADNPKGSFIDDMELETTFMNLEEKFGYKPESRIKRTLFAGHP